MNNQALQAQLNHYAALFGGTILGGTTALFSSWTQNRDVKDSIRARETKDLAEQVADLRRWKDGINGSTIPRLAVGTLADFVTGIHSVNPYVQDGTWKNPQREDPWSVSEAQDQHFPPALTQRDSQGRVFSVGEMVDLGRILTYPEVRCAIAGIQLSRSPSKAELGNIYENWRFITETMAGGPPQLALSTATINTLAAQIATTPRAGAAFSGLLSSANQAMQLALAGAGQLSAVQTQAVASYFSGLISSITGGASAISAWIASNAPALADSALDERWAVSYSSNIGTPVNTTTGTAGAFVLGSAVLSAAFHYVQGPLEPQTVRRFRLKVTNKGTAAAGQAVRLYLPKPLKDGNAPKVTLTVSGNTWAQAGYPYVANESGGSLPYFDIYVVAGTNDAVWYLNVDVGE